MRASQNLQISTVRQKKVLSLRPEVDGTEPTIDLRAVAKLLNCSVEQCRRLAESKRIPAFRIGNRWKSTTSAIVKWREQQLGLSSHSRPPEER